MSNVKYLVHINDGKRESIYKGVNGDNKEEALDRAVEMHIKSYPKVDIADIEASCVKMAVSK